MKKTILVITTLGYFNSGMSMSKEQPSTQLSVLSCILQEEHFGIPEELHEIAYTKEQQNFGVPLQAIVQEGHEQQHLDDSFVNVEKDLQYLQAEEEEHLKKIKKERKLERKRKQLAYEHTLYQGCFKYLKYNPLTNKVPLSLEILELDCEIIDDFCQYCTKALATPFEGEYILETMIKKYGSFGTISENTLSLEQLNQEAVHHEALRQLIALLVNAGAPTTPQIEELAGKQKNRSFFLKQLYIERGNFQKKYLEELWQKQEAIAKIIQEKLSGDHANKPQCLLLLKNMPFDSTIEDDIKVAKQLCHSCKNKINIPVDGELVLGTIIKKYGNYGAPKQEMATSTELRDQYSKHQKLRALLSALSEAGAKTNDSLEELAAKQKNKACIIDQLGNAPLEKLRSNSDTPMPQTPKKPLPLVPYKSEGQFLMTKKFLPPIPEKKK